jgi:hypothetical protein
MSVYIPSFQVLRERRYLHLDEGTLYRVIGIAYLEDPECYTGGSVANDWAPLPDRIRVRGQTKRDTLVLQLGVEALDQHSNTR